MNRRETTRDRPTYSNSVTKEILHGTSYSEIEKSMSNLSKNFSKFVDEFEGAASGWVLLFIKLV